MPAYHPMRGDIMLRNIRTMLNLPDRISAATQTCFYIGLQAHRLLGRHVASYTFWRERRLEDLSIGRL